MKEVVRRHLRRFLRGLARRKMKVMEIARTEIGRDLQPGRMARGIAMTEGMSL